MNQGENCYESSREVKKFDLLIAETFDHDLTHGKVYTARTDAYGTDIEVMNDTGKVTTYSIEWFRFYNGETV